MTADPAAAGIRAETVPPRAYGARRRAIAAGLAADHDGVVTA
ncbi:MAG TPA: hypothetical protein VG502_08885 [Flexivirga sp.]|nr:hypothetical protein [Flexivirga sp.]HWC22398.1 hypothetical protein [Flexivirga sp.]